MNSCFGPLYSSLGRSSPPPPSSPKLEVIQDLDLYFIRQIAHSLQEYDLEQKIDLEIKMREGTTKLLAACKHPTQTLEAAKSLLTSNERMTAYMAELQRRKVEERRASLTSQKNASEIRVNPSKAKVSVSDIRMPLIWKDSDHFKNKGDYRRFAVFCLMKIGTDIYDTLMVNNVDRSMTDITFEDIVVFNHVPHDFEFRLEVYSHVLHDDLSIASTPRKIKRKINDSISRTVGKKLAASLKEELNAGDVIRLAVVAYGFMNACVYRSSRLVANSTRRVLRPHEQSSPNPPVHRIVESISQDRGPKFDLVAHAVLKLSEVHDSIKTHDLVMENLENPHSQLPLFGHFCCRLAAQPECVSEDRVLGYLSLVQQVGDVSCLRRFWCTLRNFVLSVWTKPEEVNLGVEPHLAIPVNRETKLKVNGVAGYTHSFTLYSIANGRRQENTLVADSDNDLFKWVSHLKQHCQDQVLWKHVSDSYMEIQSPTPCRLPFFVRHRKGSLYDETPLKDGSHSSNGIHSEDPLNISPMLRPRSRSSSSSSSSATSSTSSRPSIPFFRQRLSNHESSV